MLIKISSAFFILFLLSVNLFAQGTNLPFGNRTYHLLDRLEITSGKELPYHSSVKPFLRGDAVKFGLDLLETDSSLSNRGQREIQYIFDESNEWVGMNEIETTTISGRSAKSAMLDKSRESIFYKKRKKPLFKNFYKTPANLFEVNTPDFHFRVNPMLNLGYGNLENDQEPAYLNQRGIEFRGGVDDRVFFYSNIVESQARFANYVRDRVTNDKALPGQGLYKRYDSNLFNFAEGYDFLNAQGYVGANFTEHIGMQFGHGKNFIGNGYRSLLLSDFSNNYFHLKLNWRVWRLQLQNIFAEVAGSSRNNGGQLIAKKYIAAHYLNYNVTPKLSIGFFETVIFQRTGQFELQYLNPVIFYRSIEHSIGSSPDNVMIGLNGKWNFLNRFQLYGQLILDEFKIDELLLDNQGWWANKYGFQTGLKYVDALGVKGLDLQAEFNMVRPYTYMHFDSLSNYTHFNQALAHPSGANFREWMILAKYNPVKRLFLDFRFIRTNKGDDGQRENWGSNLLLSYSTREQDYGNEIGQGISSNTNILGLDISYELFHNCYVDLQYFSRSKNSEDDALDLETTFIGAGFRLNSNFFRMDF